MNERAEQREFVVNAPSTDEIVGDFTARLTERLNGEMLDEPVRLDNTHTVVIISIKDKGRIHAHLKGGVNDEGLENVLRQIETVPSLQGLVLLP